MQRSEVPPIPTPTMVGGQTRPPDSITRSMTKRFTALMPSDGSSICRNEPFSDPDPFGIISIDTVSGCSSKSTWMIGTRMPLEVWLFFRVIGMHDRGAQRIFVRGALAAGADRALQPGAVELDVAPDHDVVDRNAGVLAKDVLGALGDRDVLDHGVEDGASGRVGFGAHQFLEPGLDVGGQDFQRLHIKRFADFFDFSQIELHETSS